MRPTRRQALGVGLAAVAVPTFANGAARAVPEVTVVMRARDEAPPASAIEVWSAYEARLRARLADGGGGRFDDAGARAAFAAANQVRTAAGSPALAWHEELALAARAHGGDLAHSGKVEHLSAEGFDPSHRLWLLGRTTIGSPSENLAYHHRQGPPASPAALVNQWRKTPEGHWQNLLRPTHTHAAFALLRGPDQALLVGLFCRPVAALAEPLPFLARGDEIAEAVRGLDPDLNPRLGPPQGARQGSGARQGPDAPGRRVMQLSAVRRSGPGQGDYVGGPVFLPTR